ncbi:MAG: hypothetical protein LBQ81_00070 [Zoogloeaceae bacterium]|jgi:hypothetical protein|nr:hypothetical protein [Zoogloeaceae bacterium]
MRNLNQLPYLLLIWLSFSACAFERATETKIEITHLVNKAEIIGASAFIISNMERGSYGFKPPVSPPPLAYTLMNDTNLRENGVPFRSLVRHKRTLIGAVDLYFLEDKQEILFRIILPSWQAVCYRIRWEHDKVYLVLPDNATEELTNDMLNLHIPKIKAESKKVNALHEVVGHNITDAITPTMFRNIVHFILEKGEKRNYGLNVNAPYYRLGDTNVYLSTISKTPDVYTHINIERLGYAIVYMGRGDEVSLQRIFTDKNKWATYLENKEELDKTIKDALFNHYLPEILKDMAAGHEKSK